MIESYTVKIKCPKCLRMQKTKSLHVRPWNTYMHDCIQCGWRIDKDEYEVKAETNREIV